MIVEILNKVKRLYTAFNTNDRIAKIDALGLPTGHIVPDGNDWNSTRAGYLTTINSRLPATTIASSTEVAKVGDGWNSTLATKLAALKAPPCATAKVLINTAWVPSQSITSSTININGIGLQGDGAQGVRFKTHFAQVANTWEDVVNELGGGYLLAAVAKNDELNAQWVNFRIVVDGFTLYERTSTTNLNQDSGVVPIGGVTSGNPTATPYPVRFNSSLLIQVKAANAYASYYHVLGLAAYLQD